MIPQPASPAPRRRLRLAARATALALVVLAPLAGLAIACQAPTESSAAGGRRPVSAPVETRVGQPSRVDIPAIGVDAEVVPVGLQADGAMETPRFGLAGWYELGPAPGQPGPAVIVAHVDSTAGPDVFYRLRELTTGDRITVRGDGTATFVVESRERVDKDELPVGRIWNDTRKPVLRLVTCGGSFNNETGHYEDNIIVYASLVSG